MKVKYLSISLIIFAVSNSAFAYKEFAIPFVDEPIQKKETFIVKYKFIPPYNSFKCFIPHALYNVAWDNVTASVASYTARLIITQAELKKVEGEVKLFNQVSFNAKDGAGIATCRYNILH